MPQPNTLPPAPLFFQKPSMSSCIIYWLWYLFPFRRTVLAQIRHYHWEAIHIKEGRNETLLFLHFLRYSYTERCLKWKFQMLISYIYIYMSCNKSVHSKPFLWNSELLGFWNLSIVWYSKKTLEYRTMDEVQKPQFQWLRLALSKGPNWVGVFPPSPENGNRFGFRNVVFSSF
jgi:hypothetical protein